MGSTPAGVLGISNHRENGNREVLYTAVARNSHRFLLLSKTERGVDSYSASVVRTHPATLEEARGSVVNM